METAKLQKTTFSEKEIDLLIASLSHYCEARENTAICGSNPIEERIRAYHEANQCETLYHYLISAREALQS